VTLAGGFLFCRAHRQPRADGGKSARSCKAAMSYKYSVRCAHVASSEHRYPRQPPADQPARQARDWTCASAAALASLARDDAGPLCLTCADLDNPVFLPALAPLDSGRPEAFA
jgi:hypothetical protein